MRLLSLFLTVIIIIIPGPVSAVSGEGGASPYVPLEPPFVVNLQDPNRIRFLQIKSQVKLHDAEASKILEHHMPLIRHTLLMIFAEQNEKTIRTLEGKEALREESLAALQSILEEETGDSLVDQIYFTDFVIQ
jgi:flagellar FliL protein